MKCLDCNMSNMSGFNDCAHCNKTTCGNCGSGNVVDDFVGSCPQEKE